MSSEITFTFVLPDGADDLVTEALCARGKYQPQIDDGAGGLMDNPQTAQQFAQQRIIDYVCTETRDYGIMKSAQQVVDQVEEIRKQVKVSAK